MDKWMEARAGKRSGVKGDFLLGSRARKRVWGGPHERRMGLGRWKLTCCGGYGLPLVRR